MYVIRPHILLRMAPAADVPHNIQALLGPHLIGNLVGYLLYGILASQLFVYHHRFPNDFMWMKSLVWALFLLDTALTVFGSVAVWDSVIKGWGDVGTLDPVNWPLGVIPFILASIASSIHVFYSWRIWKLRKSILLPAVIVLVSASTLVTGSICGFYGRTLPLSEITVKLKPYVISWLGGSALVDLTITATMVTTLFQASASASFGPTVSGISRLITLTVETGMTTAIGASMEMILFLAFPTTNMHFVVYFFLSKLYTNSLLATLNARGALGDQANTTSFFWNDDSRHPPREPSILFARKSALTVSTGSAAIRMSTGDESRFQVFTTHAPGNPSSLESVERASIG
ncbi:hypothetical protein BD779DRAFT_733690 [Infundibulicybe gibba]|nr:hypothetical protein BD779DRAFT_733690 [Infundibulicybe gibba]